MSYAFDTLNRALNEHVNPALQKAGKPELAVLIGLLVDDMHSANHRTPSADGVFPGDGVNKDREVSRSARELDEHLRELEERAKAAHLAAERERQKENHDDGEGPRPHVYRCAGCEAHGVCFGCGSTVREPGDRCTNLACLKCHDAGKCGGHTACA